MPRTILTDSHWLKLKEYVGISGDYAGWHVELSNSGSVLGYSSPFADTSSHSRGGTATGRIISDPVFTYTTFEANSASALFGGGFDMNSDGTIFAMGS